ncbi:unnamed protein product [Microthlaspi erraticum]|uniref:KIB1-4 beta-propeller domain-containing protein n=1 Tax=Microthlaspi erraticum TaxID=1685480 RepID=A0A6D2IQZ5_9BRAS|nr:unnamed protein product [Microthlaspi erraticum]
MIGNNGSLVDRSICEAPVKKSESACDGSIDPIRGPIDISDIERTVGFKVYKMDKKLVEWVEVSSLGDKAIIMCMASFLMVSASEYYGCLENAIYFTDDDGRDKVKGEDVVRVFKLEDNMIDYSSHSFLEMFRLS